jgi:tRNA guanosine-2'-O-methyltransferase
MTLELWDDATRFSFATLTTNPLFERIHRGVLASPYYKEFASAKDFRTFDATVNYTLQDIFSGTYLLGGDDIEVVPSDAFNSVTGYEDIPALRRKVATGSTPPPSEAELEAGANTLHSGKVEYKAYDTSVLSSISTSPAPIQTKSDTFILPTTSTPHTREIQPEKDVILVASLLDNAFNLGGVSRCSEILGVRTLTLHSKSLLRSAEFTSVSVHSEQHLNILEVPIPRVISFLREKRSEGYAAVGVEQTDRSVILGDPGWTFPLKTVLLLGTEKFGIPAELLGELDWCVEIPQLGVTRSMNVQTAAAVVLYEVCRQRRELG